MTHALAVTLKAVDELRLQTSDLEACVVNLNILPYVRDYSTQLNQIQAGLRDLSHRVAPVPPAQLMAPPEAQLSRARPSTVTAPHAPVARGLLHNPQRSHGIVCSDRGWHQQV